MALTKQQVHTLLTSVADTRDEEINCDTCLGGMAEFAETQLVGAEVSAALQRIQAHIAFCPECTEEYELLRDVLSSSSQGDGE